MKRTIYRMILVLTFLVGGMLQAGTSGDFQAPELGEQNRAQAGLFISQRTTPSAEVSPVRSLSTFEGTRISQSHLFGAGKNLRTSAYLHGVGMGLSLAGTAAPLLTEDEDSAVALALSLFAGSAIVGFIAPHFVGKAGEDLGRAGVNDWSRSAKSLQRYRSRFYGGLVAMLAGTAATIMVAEDEGMVFGTAMFTAGSALFTALVPPYHLTAAGSSLHRVDALPADVNSRIDKAGSNLLNAGMLRYGSFLASAAGVALIIAADDESDMTIPVALAITGTGLSLLSHVSLNRSGTQLRKAADRLQ